MNVSGEIIGVAIATVPADCSSCSNANELTGEINFFVVKVRRA